jgi:uncharacterized protein YbjT (DUF2867 family)
MKALVLGATGGTGQLIVSDAVAKGRPVVAPVRSAAGADLPEAELIEGDARNESTLGRAVDGGAAVVSALRTGMGLREVSLLTEATRALVPAMTRRGVRRPVCISALGVGIAAATAASGSTGSSSLCCSAKLTRTRTVRKPRFAPVHSMGRCPARHAHR